VEGREGVTQKEIQYAYFMNKRRQDLYRLAKFQRLEHALGRLAEIRAFIKAGGDPSAEPGMADDWRALVDEYGESIFVTEDGSREFTTEESD